MEELVTVKLPPHLHVSYHIKKVYANVGIEINELGIEFVLHVVDNSAGEIKGRLAIHHELHTLVLDHFVRRVHALQPHKAQSVSCAKTPFVLESDLEQKLRSARTYGGIDARCVDCPDSSGRSFGEAEKSFCLH
eukprot:TRINITY_DN8547_c0_g4_i6.p1 TRINITY_DN8547_c0_g4~~TRINITY_DN8547_c0_g4_i6.p1  ORF type:complete len:134 (-),score=4.02 TRINITY_DN8547_c0_g4_i6:141-542(-)